MAVRISGETAVEASTPVPLFKTHMVLGPNTFTGFRQQYDVTRDGQRFLVNIPIEETVASPITVVLNWPALLKK